MTIFTDTTPHVSIGRKYGYVDWILFTNTSVGQKWAVAVPSHNRAFDKFTSMPRAGQRIDQQHRRVAKKLERSYQSSAIVYFGLRNKQTNIKLSPNKLY